MNHRKRVFTFALILSLVLCLVPGIAMAEDSDTLVSSDLEPEEVADLAEKALSDEAVTNTAEGTIYNPEDGIVYNDGGTVFNNGGVVYNNGGLVFNNRGLVFNNAGTVYNNQGTVYNNDGNVINNDGQVYGSEMAPVMDEAEIVFDESQADTAPDNVENNTENPNDSDDALIEEEPDPDDKALEDRFEEADTEDADKSAAASPVWQVGVVFEDDYSDFANIQGLSKDESGAFFLPEGGEITITPKEGYVLCDANADSGIWTFSDDGEYILSAVDSDITVSLGFLHIEMPRFITVSEGYELQKAKGIVLENPGSRDVTVENVLLSGNEDEVFDLSSSSGIKIEAGETVDNFWTVRPEIGFERGVYTALVTIIFDNGSNYESEISFIVK